jgi:hypothetical protein
MVRTPRQKYRRKIDVFVYSIILYNNFMSSINTGYHLDSQIAKKFLSDKNTIQNPPAEPIQDLQINSLEAIHEKFLKEKENIFEFVKGIRSAARKDQAKFIKNQYGTKNIKSKICFKLIDSQENSLTEEEELGLFVFVSKFIDIK